MTKDYKYHVNYDKRWLLCARRPTPDEVASNHNRDDFIFLNAYDEAKSGNYFLTRLRATRLDTQSVPKLFDLINDSTKSERKAIKAQIQNFLEKPCRAGQLYWYRDFLLDTITRANQDERDPNAKYIADQCEALLLPLINQRITSLPDHSKEPHYYQLGKEIFSIELDKPKTWETTHHDELGLITSELDVEPSHRKTAIDGKDHGFRTVERSNRLDEARDYVVRHLDNIPEIFTRLHQNISLEDVVEEIGNKSGIKLKARSGIKPKHIDDHGARPSGSHGLRLADPPRDRRDPEPPAPEEPRIIPLALLSDPLPRKVPDDRIILKGNPPGSPRNEPTYEAYIPKKISEPQGAEEAAKAPFFCIEFQKPDGSKPIFAFEMRYTDDVNNSSGPKIPAIKHNSSLSTADRDPTVDETQFAEALFKANARSWAITWVKEHSTPKSNLPAIVDRAFPETPSRDASTLPKKAPDPHSARSKRRAAAGGEPAPSHTAAVEDRREAAGKTELGG